MPFEILRHKITRIHVDMIINLTNCLQSVVSDTNLKITQVSGQIYIDWIYHEHDTLYQTYLNILNHAKLHHIKSIEFPLISVDIKQFPIEHNLEIGELIVQDNSSI
ncbi:MAG TPA: macro domain-containing protein, partial [Acholeplasmataceae bacterium]|nr:macro domain-containing protein [Acholeplasmataceae bacterium]